LVREIPPYKRVRKLSFGRGGFKFSHGHVKQPVVLFRYVEAIIWKWGWYETEG
jgi:hypothetical protein